MESSDFPLSNGIVVKVKFPHIFYLLKNILSISSATSAIQNNIGVGQEWQSTIPERLTSVHLAFYPATQKSTSQLGRNCDSMSIYLVTTL